MIILVINLLENFHNEFVIGGQTANEYAYLMEVMRRFRDGDGNGRDKYRA